MKFMLYCREVNGRYSIYGLPDLPRARALQADTVLEEARHPHEISALQCSCWHSGYRSAAFGITVILRTGEAYSLLTHV